MRVFNRSRRSASKVRVSIWGDGVAYAVGARQGKFSGYVQRAECVWLITKSAAGSRNDRRGGEIGRSGAGDDGWRMGGLRGVRGVGVVVLAGCPVHLAGTMVPVELPAEMVARRGISGGVQTGPVRHGWAVAWSSG